MPLVTFLSEHLFYSLVLLIGLSPHSCIKYLFLASHVKPLVAFGLEHLSLSFTPSIFNLGYLILSFSNF